MGFALVLPLHVDLDPAGLLLERPHLALDRADVHRQPQHFRAQHLARRARLGRPLDVGRRARRRLGKLIRLPCNGSRATSAPTGATRLKLRASASTPSMASATGTSAPTTLSR